MSTCSWAPSMASQNVYTNQHACGLLVMQSSISGLLHSTTPVCDRLACRLHVQPAASRDSSVQADSWSGFREATAWLGALSNAASHARCVSAAMQQQQPSLLMTGRAIHQHSSRQQVAALTPSQHSTLFHPGTTRDPKLQKPHLPPLPGSPPQPLQRPEPAQGFCRTPR